MVGRYVEISYKNKIVNTTTMFVNKDGSSIQDDLILSFNECLYEQFRNDFLFLKLTATERVSMLHFDLLINNLDCISSRMYI